MEIPEKELELLDKLINDYINQVPKIKYRLTKKVCSLANKYGVNQTRVAMQLMLSLAALEHPGDRVQLLINEYTPSAPYIEKSDSGRSQYTMGWYSDTEQIHSVLLPAYIEKDGIFVDFYGFGKSKEQYLKLFKPAENIPYFNENGIDVKRNISIVLIWRNGKLYKYQINNSLWAATLYIAFFPLASVEDVYLLKHPIQFYRIEGDVEECDYWYVQRNIKELGFWNAYQWFEGCRSYYKKTDLICLRVTGIGV